MSHATITCDCTREVGPMNIDHMALGQGGLSSEPMWAERIPEIHALKPKIIRFWAQEFFNPLPALGHYQFESVDRAIAPVLATGAIPLVAINFKPPVLFPVIDEKNLTPTSWEEWEELIFQFVKHFVDQGHTGWYWEIAGETDCGEGGGCPYLGTPETFPPFYSHTAQAVLRADTTAKVGGPGLATIRNPLLNALLDHCSTQNVPLHFISWHVYTNNPQELRNSIVYAKEVLSHYPTIHAETILDEWSIALGVNTLGVDPRFLCCFIPEVVWQMKDAALDYSCFYHIRDYHVNQNEFARFFTAKGAAFVARWWNRMPQAGGLFDFQNTIRPAYFSFKMLSRLTGKRLLVESSNNSVHALAAHDAEFNMYAIMFWNFSDTPINSNLIINNIQPESKAVPFILDPLSPSSDENHRIKMSEEIELSGASFSQKMELAPWSVHLWYVHGKSWTIDS